MNRRLFLASVAAAAVLPAGAHAAPAASVASPPEGYVGPYRAWGPLLDEVPCPGPGHHAWTPEIVPALEGPFTAVRPHVLEWWDGKAWVGTD